MEYGWQINNQDEDWSKYFMFAGKLLLTGPREETEGVTQRREERERAIRLPSYA